MFRRSFQILLVATLAALAGIVGYATLRLSDAAEVLAEAEQLAASGETARAVRLLELCERSHAVQNDEALLERLWRLRLAANTELDNPRYALIDVDNLLALREDLALELDRIELLIAVGDSERARQLARAFVGAHPDHGRGLELAGVACAAAYSRTHDRLLATIEREVGSQRAGHARAAFGTFVFRPDGDPEIGYAADELAALHARDARLAAAWPAVLRDLRALRTEAQEALALCRRSLEIGGAGSRAVAIWARAMDLAGRRDDMLAACEIHRRRSRDSATAGVVAAQALLRAGHDEAVVELVDRWLPTASLQPRIDAGELGDAAADLMLARIIAAWRRDDVPTLRKALGDLGVLHRNDIRPQVPLGTAAGLVHYLNFGQLGKEAEATHAESNLRHVTTTLQREPFDGDWPDLLGILAPLRIELLQALGRDADAVAAFTEWQEARPRALAPKIAFARHLYEKRRAPAANAVVAEAIAQHPNDPALFAARLEFARHEAARTGVDGAALLAGCVRSQKLSHPTANPLQHVLCAEAALAAGAWPIARASAQAAADAMPQWPLPRQLAVEAALRGGQVDEAVQQVRRLLELFPPDGRSALLALQAHRDAGLPTAPLLATVLPVCAPDPEIRVELLRAALADDPPAALPFATGVAGSSEASPVLRLLASRALALAARPADARRLLDGVIGEIDALPANARPDLVRALTAWIGAAAEARDDESLFANVGPLLARIDLRDPAAAGDLLAAAAELAATHPRTAHELSTRGLMIAAPEARTGEVHRLAGRLALRLGQARLAEDRWLAALAFADGRAAAEELARLYLAQGRTERALQVYALVEQPTDGALAARLGAFERAGALVLRALERDPADLLAQATAAALGQPSLCDWRLGDAATSETRLELLALLADRDLAAQAAERAQGLAAAAASTTTSLLLARAKLAQGEYGEAARLHRAVLDAGAGGPLLWRELARAMEARDYHLDPMLDVALGKAVFAGDFAGSTPAMAFAVRRLVAGLESYGRSEIATDLRRKLWVLSPAATIDSADEIEAVAALPDAYEAWYLLDQVLPALAEPVRPVARDHLAALARRVVAERGAGAADVYEHARRHVERDGAHGCLVHFLLDHGALFPRFEPDPAAARSLLLGQLELAGAGRDDARWIAPSVERLLRLDDPSAVRADLEDLLRRHPACLDLWHARAVVMARRLAAGTGLDDLRHVLAHADAPLAVLRLLEFAAAEDHWLPADEARLASLPAALRDSEAGRLVRGLAALRRGAADEALPLLERAAARADGLHLQALALAHLQSRAKEGGARARAVFLRIAAGYASSSRARYAGSFAAQLAPR